MAETTVGDVFLEFQRVGQFIKVTAIDPESLTEVSIMGPPSASEDTLGRNAMRKLAYVLSRKGDRHQMESKGRTDA
ncbi:MAG: hypothetical protein U1F33_00635 [Alphaproteobacteria bacterium]